MRADNRLSVTRSRCGSLGHNLVAQSFDCTWGSNLPAKTVQFNEEARVFQAFWVFHGEHPEYRIPCLHGCSEEFAAHWQQLNAIKV